MFDENTYSTIHKLSSDVEDLWYNMGGPTASRGLRGEPGIVYTPEVRAIMETQHIVEDMDRVYQDIHKLPMDADELGETTVRLNNIMRQLVQVTDSNTEFVAAHSTCDEIIFDIRETACRLHTFLVLEHAKSTNT